MTLAGKHILVTAGPTHEPTDPVRVIANRSSGRQGFAIAAAAADAGARVTLIAGPVTLRSPEGVDRIDVETAEQMADAVMDALPADCAIMVAAVAECRRRWPEFVAAFEARSGENFLVKAPVAHGDNTEFIWLSVTALENDADFDASRIRRTASVLGILEKICDAPR